MAGRVQIVDQLRSDRRLRQHQFDGCLRGAGVDVDHADERAIGIARLKREPRDAQGDGIGEAGSGCWPRCPVRSEAPLGLLAGSGNIQPLEREARGFRSVVMTANAVLIEGGARGRRVRVGQALSGGDGRCQKDRQGARLSKRENGLSPPLQRPKS